MNPELLLPLKIYAMPDTAFQCSLIDKPSNDEILKRQSNAAENCDLARFRAAWMHPGDDFTKIRIDNLGTDTRATRRSHRDGEVAVIADEQRRPEKVGAHFGLAWMIGECTTRPRRAATGGV